MPTTERTPPPQQFAEPGITPKQEAFIMSLLEQKDLTASFKFFDAVQAMDEGEVAQFMEEMSTRVKLLTKNMASQWIERLKELPYKKRDREEAQAPTVPDGHYALEHEDDELNPIRFYRVRHGKDNTEKGGKNWEGYVFVDRYSSDDTFPVKGKERYRVLEHIAADPLRAAQLYGQHYERCAICNRRLTRKLSREIGIGPVCATKHNWMNEAMINSARARIEARGENPDEEVA